MVMDSLRYWVEVFHVDGFRFDLATTLGRAPAASTANAPFFAAIRQDPVLANVKLIAEPWDIGLGGYQVGGFPAGWSEWNDISAGRCAATGRGEGNLIGELAARMTGSADLFESRRPHAAREHQSRHRARRLHARRSRQLRAQAQRGQRRGQPRRHRTTTTAPIAASKEPTDDPRSVAMRRQLRRNLLASLMLAQGVPLMLAGDEVGNSQSGNNNAYCQDNEIGWVDWSGLGARRRGHDRVRRPARALAPALPAAAAAPLGRWRTPTAAFGVLWLTPGATEMTEEDWNFPEGRFLAYVLAATEPNGEPLFLVFNGAPEAHRRHPARLGRCRALDLRARHRERPGAGRRRDPAARNRPDRTCDLDPGVRRAALSELNPELGTNFGSEG